jgi:hypothetical protein
MVKRARKPAPGGWSYTIYWRSPKGALGITAKGASSPGRAMAEALVMAKAAGYRRPRWWEWRRRHEVNYERLVAEVGGGFPA